MTILSIFYGNFSNKIVRNLFGCYLDKTQLSPDMFPSGPKNNLFEITLTLYSLHDLRYYYLFSAERPSFPDVKVAQPQDNRFLTKKAISMEVTTLPYKSYKNSIFLRRLLSMVLNWHENIGLARVDELGMEVSAWRQSVDEQVIDYIRGNYMSPVSLLNVIMMKN